MKTLFLPVMAMLLLSASAAAQEQPQPSSVVEQPKPAPKAATPKEDSWELCPEPSDAMQKVPASAEQLQADIDRYTLCVNRAELLMKLEEMKNGPQTAAVNAMALPGGAGATTPPPLTPEQASELLNQGPSPVDAKDTAKDKEPEADVITVSDIRGANGELVARVKDQDGNIMTAKVGDKLTDGSEITGISATQVTVRKGGDTKRLDWGS